MFHHLYLLRRGCLLLLLNLLIGFAYAQTEVNTSFSDRMNYVFQQLEKNRVPHGLLLDYAMEFTNLSNFNGTTLTDSNRVMGAEFWEIYNTLYLSRIHANGFTLQSPQVLDSLWFGQRAHGKIVLAGLFYNYARLSDDAAQNNRIIIQNDQLIDRYLRKTWQNPYQTERVFALSPSTELYEGKNLQVVLPVALWQTNAAGEIAGLSIDFGDGQGYRTTVPGQAHTLSYADTGSKTWTYRLQLGSGQYLYSHSRVRIKQAIGETGCPGCRFGTVNNEVLFFGADEAFQGQAATGFITIRYRDADRGLRRPLIVVEGFDAGHITNPELQFGTSTIEDFIRSASFIVSGSQNLDNVIRNFPDYDIIYVDWQNGTDDLRRNGLLLQTIIRWVNANKEPLPGGGFADNVILGQSMGGVITRWALRDMETRLGQQHRTRLFISMDAPQQGANVPAAYQHLARHMRHLYLQTNVGGIVELFQWIRGGTSPFRVLSLSDRPASRQMLINWVNLAGNIDNTVHDQWQTELRNLGYPAQNNIRNIAISNGAECGTTQPFGPGAELLNINGKANTRFLGDLLGQIAFPLAGILLGQGGFYLGILPGRNDLKFEFIANAQPAQGASQRIYRGKISYTKSILWLIPVTVTITERNNNSNAALLPIDYYGGGEIALPVNPNDVNFQNALVRFNMSLSIVPTFCFIPTPSALDIGLNNTSLTNADYLSRYAGGAPPAAPLNTPFQNFVTAFNNQRRNEQHIGFFQRNGNWTAQELTQVGNPPPNPPSTNCSAFCENGTIAGSSAFCTSETFTVPFGNGVNYAWSVNMPGLVTTNATGNNLLVTNNGGGGGGPLTITVQITGACGITTLTKTTLVGVPGQPLFIGAEGGTPSQYCINRFYSFYYEIPPNNTDYISSVRWGMIDNNGNISYFPYSGNTLSHVFSSAGSYMLFVEPENNCGAGYRTFFAVEVTDACGFGGGGWDVQASPNPAHDDLYVTTNDKERGAKALSKNENVVMELYDFYTKQPVRQWRFKNDQQRYRLNIRNLRKGMYVLSVSKGKERQTKQIIIE